MTHRMMIVKVYLSKIDVLHYVCKKVDQLFKKDDCIIVVFSLVSHFMQVVWLLCPGLLVSKYRRFFFLSLLWLSYNFGRNVFLF